MKFFDKKPASDSFTLTSNLTVSGHIEGLVSGRIEGIVKGNVKIKGKIIIAETGTICGNVTASDVVVYGSVEGDIVATDSIAVGPKGQVGGNISSNSISIDQTAKVGGNIRKLQVNEKIDFEEVPSKMTADGQQAILVKSDMLKKTDKNKDGWW